MLEHLGTVISSSCSLYLPEFGKSSVIIGGHLFKTSEIAKELYVLIFELVSCGKSKLVEANYFNYIQSLK